MISVHIVLMCWMLVPYFFTSVWFCYLAV